MIFLSVFICKIMNIYVFFNEKQCIKGNRIKMNIILNFYRIKMKSSKFCVKKYSKNLVRHKTESQNLELKNRTKSAKVGKKQNEKGKKIIKSPNLSLCDARECFLRRYRTLAGQFRADRACGKQREYVSPQAIGGAKEKRRREGVLDCKTIHRHTDSVQGTKNSV